MMDFRQTTTKQKSTRAKAAAGQARAVPAAQAKPKANQLGRKRSLRDASEDEPFGDVDDDFMDSAWPSDDDYNPGGDDATSAASKRVAKKRKSTGDDEPPDLEQQCLAELRNLQDKVRLPCSRRVERFFRPPHSLSSFRDD